MRTVIKRCPDCPSIRHHTDDIVTALERDLDFEVEVQDGSKGEFSILVDDMPLIRRDGDTLPSVAEVEAAVQDAKPVGV